MTETMAKALELFDYLDKSRQAQMILDTLDLARMSLGEFMDATQDRCPDVRAEALDTLRAIDNTAYEVSRSMYLDGVA